MMTLINQAMYLTMMINEQGAKLESQNLVKVKQNSPNVDFLRIVPSGHMRNEKH